MKETYMINYQDKLNKFRNFVREDISGSTKNCVEVFQSQVEEAKIYLSEKINEIGENLDEVFIRTLSKDLSRYYDSFEKYLKSLSEMKSGNLTYLRRKIVLGDKNFFRDTWGEDSDNFFRTRKFISTTLKDLSLASKLNSSLDCIVTSLYRYTYKKYGK